MGRLSRRMGRERRNGGRGKIARVARDEAQSVLLGQSRLEGVRKLPSVSAPEARGEIGGLLFDWESGEAVQEALGRDGARLVEAGENLGPRDDGDRRLPLGRSEVSRRALDSVEVVDEDDRVDKKASRGLVPFGAPCALVGQTALALPYSGGVPNDLVEVGGCDASLLTKPAYSLANDLRHRNPAGLSFLVQPNFVIGIKADYRSGHPQNLPCDIVNK